MKWKPFLKKVHHILRWRYHAFAPMEGNVGDAWSVNALWGSGLRLVNNLELTKVSMSMAENGRVWKKMKENPALYKNFNVVILNPFGYSIKTRLLHEAQS